MGDPEDFDFIKYGTPNDIEKAYLKAGPLEAKAEADFAIASISHDIKAANQKIVAAQTKQAEEATEYLEKATQGGKGFTVAKTAHEKLSKSGGLTGDVIVDAAKVQAKKDELQAAVNLAAIKSVIKKKFKAGKKLSPKQQAVFDDLDQVDQDLLKDAAVATKSAKEVDALVDAQVTQKVTEKAAQRADEGVLFDDLVQIGDQDGSNVGGLFKSVLDDQEFYVKAPDTELMAKVEVLSSKLYQAAGVKVADVNLMKVKGKIGGRDVDRVGVASRIEKIDDIDTGDMGALSGAKEGFAADAWLANWDVIGNGGPKQLNLKKMADGSSFRIDTGGTLFFRAQGGRKTFSGSDIPELDSLRFNEVNSGKVFGDINEDQIVAGVARIVAISDDDIRRLVSDVMGDDADDLAEVLIGRRDVLQRTYAKQLKKYNKAAEGLPKLRITQPEENLIKESRINGYILPSDKGDIEDHEIRANFLKRKGDNVTQLNLRLRPAAMKRLEETIDVSASKPSLPDISMSGVNADIKTGIKGIMSRGLKGEAFLDKDFARAKDAIDAIEAKQKELKKLLSEKKVSQNAVDDFDDAMEYPLTVYKGFLKDYKVGDVMKDLDVLFGKKFVDFSDIAQIRPAVIKKSKEIVWENKGTVKYYQSSFVDSFPEQSGGKFEGLGTVYETKVDGVRIRYFPEDASGSQAAAMGRMEIEIDGANAAAVKKGIDALEGLGIDASRASAMDREELYLTKLFYHFSGAFQNDERSFDRVVRFKDKMEKINKLGSQTARVKALKKEASKAAKVDDITALPTYNPIGEYQEFGHGKALQLNPAFVGKEWEEFTDETFVYHDLEYGKGRGTQVESFKNIIGGGGQLASTTDRVRRGIPFGEGGSEKRDFKTGGASYVFCRLKAKGRIGREEGLVWNTKKHIRRLDAMSYSDDYYGSQRFSTGVGARSKSDKLEDWDVSLQERAVDLNGFKDHRDENRGGNNEIIFKDGLSLFEDLRFFIVRPDEKKDVIDFLKEKGYKKWPDGRELDEVIVTYTDVRNLKDNGSF